MISGISSDNFPSKGKMYVRCFQIYMCGRGKICFQYMLITKLFPLIDFDCNYLYCSRIKYLSGFFHCKSYNLKIPSASIIGPGF